jgi:hypothetical protein
LAAVDGVAELPDALFAAASLLAVAGAELPEEFALLPDGATSEDEALAGAVLFAAGCCCDASTAEKGEESAGALPLLAGVAGFAAAAFAAALEVATALVGIEAKKKIRIEPALP